MGLPQVRNLYLPLMRRDPSGARRSHLIRQEYSHGQLQSGGSEENGDGR